MFTHYIPVNSTVVEAFPELISFHSVNTVLGGFSLCVNVLLMVVFLSTSSFRRRYVLLIVLCAGDLTNSVAIVLTGLNRIQLYSTAYSTLTLPVRTSLECATEMWLIMKLIGDLLIPFATLWMGIERFTAITFPLFYRFHVDGKATKYFMVPCLSAVFVTTSIVTALLIAYTNNHSTDFYCGRKAAFGQNFGTFIYINNIMCNIVSTCLNAAAYHRTKNMQKTQPRMHRQLAVIRYYLIISVLSTLLVSLPNAIALFQLFVRTVSDSLSKPAYWMQTINSALPFFVYFGLNREFRARSKNICSRNTEMEHTSADVESTPEKMNQSNRLIQPEMV